MKTRRRTLLAKVKQHRYLAELALHESSKNNSTATEEVMQKKGKTTDRDSNSPLCDNTKLHDGGGFTLEKDANGNLPSLISQNNGALKTTITKKPSFLSLTVNTDNLLNITPPGNYQNVNSPLAGMVPSPSANVSSPKSATQPPPAHERCPLISNMECSATTEIASSPLSSPTYTSSSAALTCPVTPTTRVPTPTNTLKQGKFALLRKYRNSLEEKPKVCVTDVTVGDVTVAIHEGKSPKGFFRDRDGNSDVFW